MKLTTLRNYLVRQLFLDDENKFQIKFRTGFLLMCLILMLKHMHFVYIAQFYASNNDYDLMRDALLRQNVTNYKIMCNASPLNDSFELNRLFMSSHYLDLDIVNIRKASQSGMHSNIAYKLIVDNQTNNAEALSVLKFCTLNVKKHFYSRLFKKTDGNFLYKRTLDPSDIKLFKVNEQMYGGYYQPPYCLQDYLNFSLTNSNTPNVSEYRQALNMIKNKVKTYDYDYTVNKKMDVFLGQLASSLSVVTNYNNLKSFIESRNELTIVVIPFLRREANLKDLLLNLHSFLQRQYIQYRIVVAEQFNSKEKFNKGRLYNAAYKFIEETYDIDQSGEKSNFIPESRSKYEEIKFNNNKVKLKVNCIVMHDVDLIPESDLNLYKCQESPRHLSLSIRRYGQHKVINEYEKSPYDMLIGGVLLLRPAVFKIINGFSNEYWNWGAEDDGKPKFYFQSSV